MVVTIYVDAILAVGPPKAFDEFWRILQCHVDLDGVGSVDRFLGRYHECQKDSVGLHMNRYAQQSVDLYLSLPGATPLKNVQTPFVADGSLQDTDFKVRGQLADNASRVLMNLWWYSRLWRLVLAISALAVLDYVGSELRTKWHQVPNQLELS